MGSSKGGGTTQTIQQADPWVGSQPHLLRVFGEAQDLYDSGAIAGLAPQSADTLLAQQMQRNWALGGMPGTTAAQGLNTAFLNGTAGANPFMDQLLSETSGSFLNSNPYLDGMYDRAAAAVGRNFNDIVAPATDAAFSSAGRLGSGAYAAARNRNDQTLADTLSGMATNIYGANYDAERGRQQEAARIGAGLGVSAIGTAPTLDQLGLLPADVLGSVGAQQDSYNQALQDLDYAALARYAGLTSGNFGGTTTTTSPLYSNPLAGALGGASTGFGAASALGLSNPWTMGAFGLGGALLGLFS